MSQSSQSSISEYLLDNNLVSKIWTDYSSYITYSASFFMLRSISEFRVGESFKVKMLESFVFSGIASATEYGVKKGYLENYKLSVLPVLGKFIYDKQLSGHESVPVNLAISSLAIGIANYAFNTFNPKLVLLPTVAYSFCTINNIDKKLALVTSALATTLDVVTSNSYASWGLAGFAFGRNIASKFDEKYSGAITAAGVALGVSLSGYQTNILDQLFTPDHFINSYNTISRITNAETLNPMLEKYFITSANMNLCMSVFGNNLVMGVQTVLNNYQAISVAEQSLKTNAYNQFAKAVFLTYGLQNLVPYLIYKMPMELISSYESLKIVDYIQGKFISDEIVNADNFIQNSKSNYTVKSYLKDIEIISEDLKVIDSIVFKIPKVSQLSNFDVLNYLGVGAVVTANIAGAEFFSFLASCKQIYENRKSECESYFDKVTANDKENSITIIQKSGLNFTLENWNEINKCKHENLLFETIFSRSYDVGSFFYNDFFLKYLFQLYIGYLTKSGAVEGSSMLLYERVLGFASDAALFKTSTISKHKKVEAAAKRLDELSDSLESNNSTIQKINFTINSNSNSMKISNLSFTRGDGERKIKITVDDLNLQLGKTYAVTGGNGSGKSSFTTLLKYVIDGVADSSFKVSSGDIEFPANSVMMVPQKDYIPFKSNLLDIIYYPAKADGLTDAEKAEVVSHINALKVFASPIEVNDLYNKKETWNELSGGQKKKLFMVKAFMECPKVLIMDETFGPLDPDARTILIDQFKQSCLSAAVSLIVWHQDKNDDGTSCVKDKFFDYELHSENQTFSLYPVDSSCEF